MRWECRHSSAEVMYLEVRSDRVYNYFHHCPERPEVWQFAAVLASDHDAIIRTLFGDATLASLKTAVRRVNGASNPLG